MVVAPSCLVVVVVVVAQSCLVVVVEPVAISVVVVTPGVDVITSVGDIVVVLEP